MSLRVRLAVFVALATTLLVAIGGVAFAALLSAGMRATIEDDLRRSAQRLVSEVAAHRIALAVPNPVVAPARDESIVQILSPHGRVEYTTVRAGTAAVLTAAERARALRGQIYLQRSVMGAHNPRLLRAAPLASPTGALLVVGASLDELDNAMSRLEELLVAGGVAVVVVASLGAFLLAGRALRPVEKMRVEAEAIAATLPGPRLAAPGTYDEVARLAETLNNLLDRLQSALSHQREFVAVASHELRTPLAVVQAELDLARRPGRSAQDQRRSLEIAGARVNLLSRLADDLLLLARGDDGGLPLQRAVQPLEPIATETLGTLRSMADAQAVILALDADPDVASSIDAARMRQVLDNLIANAIEHAAIGGLIEVLVREDGNHAVLEVKDRGSGFPPDLLGRAFERFVRGESARSQGRRGAGLGLSIVRLIVEAHDGSVEARNRAGGGASVIVRLPLAARKDRAVPPVTTKEVPRGDACTS